jgi:hypothetical protein
MNGAETAVVRVEEEIIETKIRTPKTVQSSSPEENGFFSSETSTIEERRKRKCLF